VTPATRLHGLLTKDPVTPDCANITVPVGVVGVALESVTVAVQVSPTPVRTGDEHVTIVVVGRLTATLVVPLLPLWAPSPG